MSEDQMLQNAAYVQRLLKRIEGSEFSLPLNARAFETNIYFQLLCLVFAGIFAAYEVLSGGIITSSMLLSTHDSELGRMGMSTVLIILFGLILSFYFLVWRASVAAKREFGTYVEANFKYLKNLSLVSDLFVRFACLYLLVVGGQAQYVSVLLMIFIGDYLIQGRYFNLPLRLSIFTGVVVFISGFLLFYLGKADVIYPLGFFMGLSLLSIAHLVQVKKAKI